MKVTLCAHQDHKTAMCQECAATVHKHCSSISTVANVANEKKEKLKTAEKVLQVRGKACILRKCTHKHTHARTHTYTRAHTHTHKDTHARVYLRAHTNTHTHARVYAHTQRHAETEREARSGHERFLRCVYIAFSTASV